MTFLATLPPGAFLKAVMEVRPYVSSFNEAAHLVRNRLLLQHSGPMEQVEGHQPQETFLSPRPTVVNGEATETMPAVIRERRLRGRHS
jgi:hypothetical protein